MSKPKVFEKPVGVKDLLPEAVDRLRQLEANALECMRRWGYREIMTPTLEFYDTVGVASATTDKKLFKLLDRWGTTLVMRSDMTAPIARVVASLLRDMPVPIRLSYHANVFRAIEGEAGRSSEFFQTGVELVGDASAEADAEVVALSIASLKAAGVRKFRVALGHVAFFHGLLEEMLSQYPEAQNELKDCLLRRDYVGYRAALQRHAIPEVIRHSLESILRLRGGREVCEQALALTQHPMATNAIRHLIDVWDALEAYDVVNFIIIDLTMTGDFNYYTGLTFEGYASDLGFPVLSGGRYDNLLEFFGRPAPATGFSLKTNRILEYLATSQMNYNETSIERVLVQYHPARRLEAIRIAGELRTKPNVEVTTMRCDEAKQEQEHYSLQASNYHRILTFA
jgi:ATP phosphoribosyltransferase regulatory subunit